MNLRISPPILTICLANALILILGGTAAILLCSGRAVERTGAVVAAATSLFVIWQVVEEIRMDTSKSTIEPNHKDEMFLLPIERTAARLQAAAKRRQEYERHQERLKLVGVIALWLFIGELLHGFGDLIFDAGDRLFS
jgi:ABC-type nickel/cobalt efflux system permease component RcnA